MKVQVTKSTQTAIPELNREVKEIYYLILGEGEDKIVINIGRKTHDSVEEALRKQTTDTKKTK